MFSANSAEVCILCEKVIVFVTAGMWRCFLSADPWFEISPHEAGYSHTGVFVETSSFGSQFDNGCKIKNQPEMDMLYLQGIKLLISVI